MSKVYDLAVTIPSCMKDWIYALLQASSLVQNANLCPSTAQLISLHTSSRNVRLDSVLSFVDSSVKELVDVPGAVIPDAYYDRMEGLVAEFVAHARDNADGWQLQTDQRGVKAYVRRASRLGMIKGVGFIAQHPRKVLQLVLELSRRHTYDPQLLAAQRVHVFNDHTWVDHFTYKAIFPAAERDFVNLTHWRVLADGSIVAVATYADDDTFVKSQEPQIMRDKTMMTGFLITPNEDYTGVNATYVTKVELKAGILARVQTKMLIKQAFVVDRLRKALNEDKSLRHQKKDGDQDDHGESRSMDRPNVVPEEGFPAVPVEYGEIIEKAVARMEDELNDISSWDFIGDKDGVKAYTKVDGSLTAAKGVGFLAYHPRVIWDQFIDAAKRKLVDHQLGLGMTLKVLNAHTSIDYLEYKSKFVVAGRDFCNLVHWRVLPDDTIIVVAQSIEDLEICPLKEPKVVRGDLHFACTKIVPNAAYDGAMVTTIVKTDLKGSIPARIAGKVAAEQPFVIARMGEIIKARRDLNQVAAQGKLTNTVFKVPNKRSLSSGSAMPGRSSIIKEVSESRNVDALLSNTSDGKCQVSEMQASKQEAAVKLRKNTVLDVGTYMVQFGGAVLVLETISLPTILHFVVVILLILFFELRLHPGSSQVSSRNK
ncbi:unnamed protein product [Peronospora belbahrii]|uniref:START domain-containing protein n=1 Tax=Peronospora belbahrii TaxID=622444 RepID=A0AAU9KR20_9STRA|nr:unnamed protein product [Peronospora belbahrii]